MREIKFRGKRIDNGQWCYGYYAVHKMAFTGEMDYFIIVDEQRPQSVDPDTVGQATGLKDKNGKEIYEGDIINGSEVYWSTQWAMFSCKGETAGALIRFADMYGVTGNIYDNPVKVNP